MIQSNYYGSTAATSTIVYGSNSPTATYANYCASRCDEIREAARRFAREMRELREKYRPFHHTGFAPPEPRAEFVVGEQRPARIRHRRSIPRRWPVALPRREVA